MTWCTAYQHLQDALAVAIAGDEIRVAGGVYKPDRGGNQTPGDREATFSLISGVAIYGGFAGCGVPDPDERNIAANATLLSGDLNSDDVGGLSDPSRNENSYHVVTAIGVDETAVLDGFTISAGNADGSGHQWRGGGGMYNDNHSSPTLTNCAFSDNLAYEGGGMGNYGFSAPTLTNCTFTGNSGADGGGMYNYFGFPTLTNCTFSGNSGDCGSGIHIHYSALTLTNCILWDGGDEVYEYCSTTTITYSDIQGGWPGEGNIRADPLFVPGPAGCHYLSQTLAGQAVDSPCVDTGSDLAENLGFDTMTTRSDEDTDTGIVDMGYHYPVTGQSLLMGDFDRDADVDLGDFAGLQNCFTGEGPADVSPCCRIFDFGSDSDVDLDDYAEFRSVLMGP
jgi:hypothetical protein